MIFRGETPEGKVAEGYYLYLKHFPGGWMDEDPEEHDRHMIFPARQECSNPYDWEGTIHRGVYYTVLPHTLAMSTTIKDKNQVKIFGSFEYEPGKMSAGGDEVKCTWENGLTSKGVVEFWSGAFRVLGSGGTYDWLYRLDRKIKEYRPEVIPKQEKE